MLSFIGSTPTLYGLDVLALSDADPVDPERARIRTIGIATDAGAVSFSGDEATVLADTVEFLRTSEAGCIVTWRGATLVLPLLVARAEIIGLDLGLRCTTDRRGARVDVLGFEQPLLATWLQHQHLDLKRFYDERAIGEPEQEPETDEFCDRDPANAAGLLRSMARRRWDRARRSVDPTGHPSSPSFSDEVLTR